MLLKLNVQVKAASRCHIGPQDWFSFLAAVMTALVS